MTDPDDTLDGQPGRRRALEAADELARMGVDPAAIGLSPANRAAEASASAPARDRQPADPPRGLRPPDDATAPDAPWADAPWAEAAVSPWGRGGSQTPGSTHSRPVQPDAAPETLRSPHRENKVRSVPRARPAPTGAGVTVKAFGAGLLTAGSARRMQDERRLVARVRAPQHAPQVVSFVAGKGGVGTTTTAAGVALTLTTLRDDRSALLDARAGTDSLGRWLSDPSTDEPRALPETVDELSPYASLRLPNGLKVVDGAPSHIPMTPSDLAELTDELRNDHAFTVIDVGNDVGAAAHQALACSTRIVVVTAAERHALRTMQLALDRIGDLQPDLLVGAVVAVVCRARWQYRRAVRELRGDLGAEMVVLVPFEPALPNMDQLSLPHLKAGSRQAYVRIAAALAGPSPAPARRPDRQPARRGAR